VSVEGEGWQIILRFAIQGNSDGVFLNRKDRKGRKETLFLILFALFAGFAVRCG